ncbi:MAG: cytochrome C [Hyphomicrobium sp.]
MTRPLTAALTALLFPIGTIAADSDSKIAFNDHCRECHSFLKGDNRLGPTLYGTVGRKAGSVPDFPYSISVKSSGMIWDEAALDKWIANPDAVIPGNDMSPPYPGVADPAIRKKIIAFLKEISPQDDAKGE